MSASTPESRIERRAALFARIPVLSAPRALALLTVEHIAQDVREVTPENPVRPDEVAAASGLSLSAASTNLRELARAGLVAKTFTLHYETEDAVPKPRVGYLPTELLELEEAGS